MYHSNTSRLLLLTWTHSSCNCYSQGTLSAVVQRLQELRGEKSPDQRSVTIHLCASAYPDVRPWQVDRECRGLWKRQSETSSKDADFHNLYYNYLTFLLHPTEGQEGAKLDAALVLEWTEMSARGCLELTKQKKYTDANERKKNFFSVASKASSDHLSYTRDLISLLSLSMEMEEFILALDLGKSRTFWHFLFSLNRLSLTLIFFVPQQLKF